MRIVLYPHGGSGNHGCEALVRSTVQLLKGNDISLLSRHPEQDKHYGLAQTCRIIKEAERFTRKSFSYCKAFVNFYLCGDRDAFEALTYKNLIPSSDRADIALSFGGDNYCYAKPTYIYIMNRLLRKRGVRTVLWGCSIEPSFVDEEMLTDLKGYEMIIARESITYHALKQQGLMNLMMAPDPAFALNRVDLPLPKHFLEGKTVGINVSPMIMSYEKHQGITYDCYRKLMLYILNQTDMNIALIPHVVWEDNDDREPLQKLYDEFESSNRVVLIEDHTAEELKGYIARCRFLVAARTHASIAAYSQAVPTLVVGYSVKARGIASDLFGTDEGFVIPVQSFKDSYDLTRAFQWLYANEENIRNLYRKSLGRYIAGVQLLKKVLV